MSRIPTLKEFFCIRENAPDSMVGAKDITPQQFKQDMTNLQKNATQQMSALSQTPGLKIKKKPGTMQDPAGEYFTVDAQGNPSKLDPTTGSIQKDPLVAAKKPGSPTTPTPPGTATRTT